MLRTSLANVSFRQRVVAGALQVQYTRKHVAPR